MVTEKVGAVFFKDPFLMGVFLMPTLNHTNTAPINMISSINSGNMNSYDPWVIPTLTYI